MRSLVIHGKGSSPEKVEWLAKPLRSFGEVIVPEFELEVKDGVRKALSYNFDCIAGHSRGGLIALIAAAIVGSCVIAVSAPSDRIRQKNYLSKFPEGTIQYKNYQDLLKIPDQELIQYSAINYADKLKKVLLLHGDKDEMVEKEQSITLCNEIKKNNGNCTLYIIDMKHSPPKSKEKEISAIIENWIKNTIL
ncbi:prolyl oligopeptidase family serine peptidase [Acidianus sulfidivorans JP7]|uniref:Dipeptidyl aminopeptidase n=1 Tax=Acidianus sulfidivorans JP7 TaxID=619593 RepID=A0A2U9IK75_9CREN|nr:prolyl oligopeptidase family serine peptidase [Acidianus sulfidivorans]AWR96428.1 prolyl oligopeptidase family serine peptidase [Acidianus sulfidivorans JP7]